MTTTSGCCCRIRAAGLLLLSSWTSMPAASSSSLSNLWQKSWALSIHSDLPTRIQTLFFINDEKFHILWNFYCADRTETCLVDLINVAQIIVFYAPFPLSCHWNGKPLSASSYFSILRVQWTQLDEWHINHLDSHLRHLPFSWEIELPNFKLN